MPYNLIIDCVSLSGINGGDCVGDSRHIINDNILNLGTAACTLSTSVSATNNSLTTLSAIISSHNTLINTLSTSFNTNNVVPPTTLTTHVSSLQLFLPNGTYIGFVPIYLSV